MRPACRRGQQSHNQDSNSKDLPPPLTLSSRFLHLGALSIAEYCTMLQLFFSKPPPPPLPTSCCPLGYPLPAHSFPIFCKLPAPSPLPPQNVWNQAQASGLERMHCSCLEHCYGLGCIMPGVCSYASPWSPDDIMGLHVAPHIH